MRARLFPQKKAAEIIPTPENADLANFFRSLVLIIASFQLLICADRAWRQGYKKLGISFTMTSLMLGIIGFKDICQDLLKPIESPRP